MKRYAYAVAVFGVAGVVGACKRSPRAEPPRDAGALVVAESAPAAPSAPASTWSAAPPPLPLASDALELVAVGKTWTSKIVWLTAHGSRVWLSGTNLDAYADEDGPLVPAPDLLKGLPYESGKHSIRVVGAYPRLFALRTKNVSGRIESPEATVFVYRESAWTQAKPLADQSYPHAFVAWGSGALLVGSQIQLNAAPFYEPGALGTTFEYVGPDGAVSAPRFRVEKNFMAWTADSDGTTLSLLGTRGDAKKDDGGLQGSTGIWLARGTEKDGFRATPLLPGAMQGGELYMAKVHEHGGAALVTPPTVMAAADQWRPATALFVVRDGSDGKADRRIPDGDPESCQTGGAALVGDDLYVVRSCFGDKPTTTLLRTPRAGAAAQVKVPMLAKKEGGGFRVAKSGENAFACRPRDLVVRGGDDLWIVALCGGADVFDTGGIPAVFRRGRPQEPVILP
jgi:hypothetical protein